MIQVLKNSVIYVLCPPNFATGGPEVLHQLNYKLRLLGYNSVMYYHPSDIESPIHQEYKIYNPPFEISLDDNPKNLIIIPETYSNFVLEKRLKNIKVVIWWLSVDNYFHVLNEKIKHKSVKPFYSIKNFFVPYKFADLKFLKNAKKISNLVQSHYAWGFLEREDITVTGYLSDYLNPGFKRNTIDLGTAPRKDIVLYNPKKGFEFTEQLIKTAPELTWLPLENMSTSEVAKLLQKSKVYIDFGHHPGKDRFPREAAIMGCCVITGKQGSADFFEDLPIPDEFKFDEFNIDPLMIIEKIKNCLNYYTVESKKFNPYREIIRLEEKRFEDDLLKIFEKVNE